MEFKENETEWATKSELDEVRRDLAVVAEAITLFQEFIEGEFGEMTYFHESGSYNMLAETLNKLRVNSTQSQHQQRRVLKYLYPKGKGNLESSHDFKNLIVSNDKMSDGLTCDEGLPVIEMEGDNVEEYWREDPGVDLLSEDEDIFPLQEEKIMIGSVYSMTSESFQFENENETSPEKPVGEWFTSPEAIVVKEITELKESQKQQPHRPTRTRVPSIPPLIKMNRTNVESQLQTSKHSSSSASAFGKQPRLPTIQFQQKNPVSSERKIAKRERNTSGFKNEFFIPKQFLSNNVTLTKIPSSQNKRPNMKATLVPKMKPIKPMPPLQSRKATLNPDVKKNVVCDSMISSVAPPPPLTCHSPTMPVTDKTNMAVYKLDMKRPSGWPVKCEMCNKVYSSRGVLSRHVKESHQAEPQFACFYCPSKFRTGPARLEHMNAEHPEDMKSTTCPFCSRLAASSTGKRNHMLMCKKRKRDDDSLLLLNDDDATKSETEKQSSIQGMLQNNLGLDYKDIL